MQCTYLVWGKRCRRQAEPNAGLCVYHLAWAMEPEPEPEPEPDPAPRTPIAYTLRPRRPGLSPPRDEQSPAAAPVFSARVSDEARHLLDDAYQAKGLKDEIALLRVMIRWSFEAGDFEGARRSIVVLDRLLRNQPSEEDSWEARIGTILDSFHKDLEAERGQDDPGWPPRN